MQALFYASAVIYPIAMVVDRSAVVAQAILMNPVAQAIQDIRQTLIYDQTPTLFSISGGNMLLSLVPISIVIIVLVFGALFFKKQSPTFAENV